MPGNGTTGYDQAIVTAGPVNITGANLNLLFDTGLYAPAAGDVYTIIDNRSAGTVTGAFAGLPDGTVFMRDGNRFAITYVGGNGNDVVLTVPNVAAKRAKGQIRNELAAMTLSYPGDQTKLLDAVQHLNRSLEDSRWVDDSHPKLGAKGESVFNEEKSAVVQLKALRDGNKSGVDKGVFQGYIDRLLAVDRLLAKIAIDEAAGGNAGKLNTAQAELMKGDDEAGRDHPDKAIDHYKNAWKNAIAA